MKVVWTAPAEADLDGIVRHIVMDSVEAAFRVEERLLAAAGRLADYPRRGRRGRVENTRELVVARTPYLLIYRLAEHQVEVLKVIHGAQRWPPEGA